jgi:hypothetical protein
MRIPTRLLTLSAFVFGATAAAAPPALPERPEQRVLGVLEFHSQPTIDVIQAPETVRAGEPFVVVVRTFGGGCERPGDAGVIVSTDIASIMPYDLTTATMPDAVCNTLLKRFVHAVVVQFDRPANATIRIWGRRVQPGLPPGGEPIVLERRVVVAP